MTGALAVLAAATVAVPGQVTVTAADPALRAFPRASAPLTGRAYADQVVAVTARQGPWLRATRFDGEAGWIARAAVRPLPRCRPTPLGTWAAGHLRCSWTLAAHTDTWTTWDFPLDRAPNRSWRRHGTERLIAVIERVAAEFHHAHPARRLLVGDLSRPNGGPFGPRYGGVGHASHQLGLDADVFYPRRDGQPRPATTPSQVDVPLAREVVRDFGRQPTSTMFVGCERDYVSASPKAQRLCNGEHENHVHVRLPLPTP